MGDTRKIVRAFLASPGDLEAERMAAREAVDEFNDSWADELGYQVELIGWEETIPGYGRPQELINQDLDRCDLFLGMLWKRWGTPPDRDGQFSSGFHEEYERAVARRKHSGKPEICLFFKDVDDEFKEDPGPDLERVLEFKRQIIADKSILFQTFSNARGMESHTRKSVTQYINRLKREEEASRSSSGATKHDKIQSDSPIANRAASSPLSAEGFEFLERFIQRVGHREGVEDLTPFDVARFRLLSNSITKQGNHESQVGVHDLNLLFASVYAGGVELGQRETWCLARLGFRHLQHQTAPLWRWYMSQNSKYDLAVVSSFSGSNDDEKCGAISVLTALGRELPDEDDLKRQWILNWWFSEDSSDRVRNAALGYLSRCGDLADLEVARSEYDRSASGTARNSLECMIQISLRVGGPNAAELLVLETQFDSLDDSVLLAVLNRFDGLDSDALMSGLKHRNHEVRLRSIQALRGRREIQMDLAERLLEDGDADIRKVAIDVLRDGGRAFEESEVNRFLVRPQPSAGLGLLAIGGRSDAKGEKRFSEYLAERLRDKRAVELEKLVATALPYDDDAFFAVAERKFSKYAAILRTEVDSSFEPYFEERIRRMEALVSASSSKTDLVAKTREHEEIMRKDLTRRGLDLLCKKGKKEDLLRVRGNLRTGYCGASVADAQFLEKNGEWADIELLADAEPNYSGASSTILGAMSDNSLSAAVAKMALALGRNEISKLVTETLPAPILELIVRRCPDSRFTKVSDKALLHLLDHESEAVRRAASVKAITSLPASRTKRIMVEYVEKEEHRYYNVIHWLDMGDSLSRAEARRAAKALGE